MAHRHESSLLLVPGRMTVRFVVQVDGSVTVLKVHAAHFLDGLKAACALCSFAGLQREDQLPEEILPWAGNV